MIDYWVVLDKKTNKIITYCGEEKDAIMMVLFDPHKRRYQKQKFILDQVINISHFGVKELPGQLGLPKSKNILYEVKTSVSLPSGEDIPINLY